MSIQENELQNSHSEGNSKRNVILINNKINLSLTDSNFNQMQSTSNKGFQKVEQFSNNYAENNENKEESAILNNIYPQFDNNKNYYQEFWKIYLHNEVMISEMKDYVGSIKELKSKIQQTEDLHKQLEVSKNNRSSYKKKNRRTADEILKEHICPYPKCNKAYGSDVSLNLHIKIKHGGGNKTEREKLARAFLLAEMNGEKIPSINLCLPPGYLEKFKDQCSKKTKRKKDGISESGDSFFNEDEIMYPQNPSSKIKKL